MRTKCFVLTCSSKSYGPQISEVTWHRFPSDENLLDTWIKEIVKDNSGMDLKNIVFKDMRICSVHFEKKYFKITKTGKHSLIKGAVPTIFPSSNPQRRPLQELNSIVPVRQRINHGDAQCFGFGLSHCSNEPANITTTTCHELYGNIAAHPNDGTCDVERLDSGLSHYSNVSDELPPSSSSHELDLNVPQHHSNGNVSFESLDTGLSHSLSVDGELPPFEAFNELDHHFFSDRQPNSNSDLESRNTGATQSLICAIDHFRSTALNEFDHNVTERNSNRNTDMESLDTRVSISLNVDARKPQKTPHNKVNSLPELVTHGCKTYAESLWAGSQLSDVAAELSHTNLHSSNLISVGKRDANLIRTLRYRISELEKQLKKLEKLVGSNTIALLKCDKRMSVAIDSLVTVFEEESDKHCEKNAKACFLLHQLLNYKLEPKRVRYDQWTIKYSIGIQGRSPTIYEFLRQQNLLTLPCLNTLFSYTGRTKGKVGITPVNLERLKMVFKTLTKEHERSISVELDEMACKPLLLWIQSRQQFVGEVNFGEVDVSHVEIDDEELDELLSQFEDENVDEVFGEGVDPDGGKISENAAFMKSDGKQNTNQPAVLANSLINFVMTGLTTKFSSIVGSWPVAKLTGRQLFCLTIHVIRTLEEIGFKVERLVADNAKINVCLFKLLRKPGDMEPFVVTHPCDPSRKLFLSYDYTHVIKNVRNQLIDRNLTIDGEQIDFNPIKLLYEKTLNDRLAICRFLSRKHIAPTNYERMKVCYARDIFRPELTAALRTMQDFTQKGFENVENLCNFLEYFWRWYNYHDVCNFTQSTFQRLEIKKPFSEEDDPRLYELDVEIPEKLTNWFKSKKNPLECMKYEQTI